MGELEYKLNLLSESYAELENHNMTLQNIINSNNKGNVKIPVAPKAPKMELLGTKGDRTNTPTESTITAVTKNSSHLEYIQKDTRVPVFSSAAPVSSSSAATALASMQPPRPTSGNSDRNGDNRKNLEIVKHARSSSSSPPPIRNDQSRQLAVQDSFRAVSPQKEVVFRSKNSESEEDNISRVPDTIPTESEQRKSPYSDQDIQISREISRGDSFSTTSQSSVTAGGTKVKRKSLFKSVGKFIMGKNKEKKAQATEDF